MKPLDYKAPTTAPQRGGWRQYFPWLVILVGHLVGSAIIYTRCYIFWDDDPHPVRAIVCQVFELPLSAVAFFPGGSMLNSQGGFPVLAAVNALCWTVIIAIVWEAIANSIRR
jgi:hypothetical protein